MSDQNPGTVEDVHDVLARLERVSSLFHDVNRIIPEDQQLVTIRLEAPAGEALALMRQHGYSQLPVSEGGEVLGVFSYRGFALGVAAMAGKKQRQEPADTPVSAFLDHEEARYADLRLALRDLVGQMHGLDAMLVSNSTALSAIVTPMDVLRHVHAVASAFMMLEEIELSVRKLIRMAAPTPEALAACVARAQPSDPDGHRLPGALEEMTFEHYVALLRRGDNWPVFQPAFGGTSDLIVGKLGAVRLLRNDVFHFRRTLEQSDRETLFSTREVLRRRVVIAERQAGRAS